MPVGSIGRVSDLGSELGCGRADDVRVDGDVDGGAADGVVSPADGSLQVGCSPELGVEMAEASELARMPRTRSPGQGLVDAPGGVTEDRVDGRGSVVA